ncbi:MAG: inosine monophosphate cyclohydrolase [Clostridia bacterium]|nr:inosine monophosphate cyclohydrolase [Clostridia bacterium]
MKAISLGGAVGRVSYPGCGMIAGRSADGLSAVVAYFIMGRSPLTKNRLFVEEGGGVKIEPYRKELMRDEALLVYSPVVAFENKVLVGNGPHIEQIYSQLTSGNNFEDGISHLTYIPDAPNFTPRLTGLISTDGESFNLKMSLVKSMDPYGASVGRYTYEYESIPAGTGYYLHTCAFDANPLPAFSGEPIQVSVNGSIFDIVADIWENMNAENKVSLWVRTIDLKTHKSISRIINKNR